jgi:hypothetical protein
LCSRSRLALNASKVGDFEAGRSAPTFATVLTVSLALEHTAQEAAEAREEMVAGVIGIVGWVWIQGRDTRVPTPAAPSVTEWTL